MKKTETFDRAKVEQLIEAKGLRKEWVAKQLGISRNHFSQCLSGRRNPSKPLVKLMAHLLDVDEGVLDLTNQRAS